MCADETLQVPLRGVSGEDKGLLSLATSRLDCRVRYPLLKEAAVMYAANKRVGSHSTKTRGEIVASTRKPYRQKGTGHARAGTRKSPLWRGGGVVFGPHPRDYSYAIHRKQRRLATRSALLSRFQDGQVVVVDELDGLLDAGPKTRRLQQALKAVGVSGTCLIGTPSVDKNLVLSARNIPGLLVAPIGEFNALDVLKVRTVVLTRQAFDALEAGDAFGAQVRPGAGDDRGEAEGNPDSEEGHPK